jgi:hypothetical protein
MEVDGPVRFAKSEDFPAPHFLRGFISTMTLFSETKAGLKPVAEVPVSLRRELYEQRMALRARQAELQEDLERMRLERETLADH